MEKEAFWTFLEHKSKEIDKVPKFAELVLVTASSWTLRRQALIGQNGFWRIKEGRCQTWI